MASKYVLFVSEVNREFGKLLEMTRDLKKSKDDYVQSWKDLGLPWTDDDIERLAYLYETSDYYQEKLDEIARQRTKIENWLIANEVDEKVASAMVFTL